LPVDIQFCDYRTLQGQFDRIYSLGMFEHVGMRNYVTYFQTARRLLKEDGLMLLHTIGQNISHHANDP
jgi:cyclopropane-fatty-acyl-phospholipid synthase